MARKGAGKGTVKGKTNARRKMKGGGMKSKSKGMKSGY